MSKIDDSIRVLVEEFNTKDSEAYGFHINIVNTLCQEGVDELTSNIYSARIMENIFNVHMEGVDQFRDHVRELTNRGEE